MIPATVRSTTSDGDLIIVSDEGNSSIVPRAVVEASVFRLLRVGQRLAVSYDDGVPMSIHLPGTPDPPLRAGLLDAPASRFQL